MRRGGVLVAAVSFSAIAFTACGPTSKEGGPGGGGETADAAPGGPGRDADPGGGGEANACVKMDLLFVIDDSDSMREEQVNLISSFPAFVEAIDAFRTGGGGALDYRVAVTTTGVNLSGTSFGIPVDYSTGPNGEFVRIPGLDRPWIERNDADVITRFSDVAEVGILGSPMEAPLRALELSLSDRVADGRNMDFLRDDALLAVVILTDEDDCSYPGTTADISPFDAEGGCGYGTPGMLGAADVVGFLDAKKGSREKWAAAVIAGPPPNECESTYGAAWPAQRLHDFTQAAGSQAVFSSICEGDLAGSLADALSAFSAACQAFPID